MKVFVDENIPLTSVTELRALGHDVMDIRGTADQGLKDEPLWQMVQHEQRLFITTDKGFTQYRNQAHFGLLIIRLRQPNRQKIHERVMAAINQFTPEQWPGLMVVVRDAIQSSARANAEASEDD